jgi:hypothetical protein
MLDRDVDSRITIEKVLDHPWCLALDADEWGLLRREVLKFWQKNPEGRGRQHQHQYHQDWVVGQVSMHARMQGFCIISKLNHD